MSFSLYAATVKEAPVSVTLDHFESLGDRMGSYKIESISPNVSGSILLKDCVSRGGAAPGLALREPPRYRCHLGCILLKMAAMSLFAGGKPAAGASVRVEIMRLINTATKMWIPGGEALRFPVSIMPNGPNIGVQGGIHFANLTVVDALETLPGGGLPLGPLEGSSKRAWLNATDPAGLRGISGDVTVVNAHGCSEIVRVGGGAPKGVALNVTCVASLKTDEVESRSPFSYGPGAAPGLAKWFRPAKLGLFMHWTPVSQKGWEITYPLLCCPPDDLGCDGPASFSTNRTFPCVITRYPHGQWKTINASNPQGKITVNSEAELVKYRNCLLYTSPSPRDATLSRMPSSA